MNEYQENSKSQGKRPKIPTRAASFSSSSKASPLTQNIPISNIPLNAPTQEASGSKTNELDTNAQKKKFIQNYPQAANVDKSKWIDKTGEREEDKIQYRNFGDYRVYSANYMAQTLAEKCTTILDAAQQGNKAAAAMALPKAQKSNPKRSSNLLSCCKIM